MARTGKLRSRDVKQSKETFRLSGVIRDLLYEASKNYPEGGATYLKQEWVEVTSAMICEVVKRRRVPTRKMMKRAKVAVAEHLEERRFRQVLKTKFPDWDLGAATTQSDHVDDENPHEDNPRD